MQKIASIEDPIRIEQFLTHLKKKAQVAFGTLCGDMLLPPKRAPTT